MIVFRNVALIGIAAVAVSGCSSTGSGGSDDNGPSYLHGYNPTIYQDGTTLKEARAEGIEGLAVTAGGQTTASVTTTPDRINVVVDGSTYDLPIQQRDQDRDYVYALYEDKDDPSSAVLTYDGEYSGFAVVFGDGEGGGDLNALIVTGQETENLPSQQASYAGDWVGTNSNGNFNAEVDFDARSIDYSVDGYEFIGRGSGQLSGSQFAGDIEFSGEVTGSGSITGALFGPQAEEIAGTSHGTLGGEDYQAVFHGRQE